MGRNFRGIHYPCLSGRLDALGDGEENAHPRDEEGDYEFETNGA